MKKDVNHENFERFLKDNADDLQLRPAADVWDRIEGRLNRRRRLVFLTSAFFLLTASLFGYLIVDQAKHPSDPFAGVHTTPKQTTNTPAFNAAQLSESSTVPAAPTVQRVVQHTALVDRTASTKLFQTPIPVSLASALLNPTPEFIPVPVDELQPFVAAEPTTATGQKEPTAPSVLTIESVVNLYKPKSKNLRSEFQYFFTPTISYRRLTENKSYLRSVPRNLATANLAALYDVNSMVTHKPDMGLEMGMAYKYKLNNWLKLRTGLQFNITRYGIKAFTYVPERTTIALNNRARGVDSVSTMSSYRNFSGGSPDWLQNFYFQASAPIGIEVAHTTRKKTYVGAAATIQPTYVLGDRAYLISTDYKNYSQVPWLIRRWNVNTSLETFISYSTGKLRWQVGPQVRYQLLSSFVQQYPVKENLFDFGMKVGVSLDKK